MVLLKSEGIETIKVCAGASRWAASVLQEGCDKPMDQNTTDLLNAR